LLVIIGPTASGKSAAALTLAAERGGEIISCDSMQVYRGLDIGTAKPGADERARVPHHLIDVAEPGEEFSAARWAALADRAIAEVRARGRQPIVVGGTGLYLRALRFGLVEAPPRDLALREKFQAEERAQPGALHARLATVDPEAAARLQPRDLVRIVRALEVAALTGTPLSRHHAAHAPVERYPMRVALIDPGPALDAAIVARAARMLDAGLVDETRRAREKFGAGLAALGAVGYREAAAFLDGKLTRDELPAAIARATRRYARRQRTWFKKEPGARHFSSVGALLELERKST
jgi:tRNA dimethylallyltransferase